MPFEAPFANEQLEALLIALCIGLLIGLERERVTSARAGLRTFALVTVLGALTMLIGKALDTVLPFAAGFLVVGGMIVAAYLRHPDPNDPGTTSVAALLVSYCLGGMVWLGYTKLAVMLAIATTILLYFKAQLRGLASRLTSRDWISILQFGVLSLVILPILPNQDYGPYGALNPHQIWWMVVLISGVSLAGYAALQITGARYGAPMVGLFGGMASSTATTLVYARNARGHADMAPTAALVILIANLVMIVRVVMVATVVAPKLVSDLIAGVAPALLLGLAAIGLAWRSLVQGEVPLPSTSNPTELKTALGFGLLYAVVLFCAAWLSDYAGNRGLYVVALVSGLTDIDAIALTSLRFFALDKLDAPTAVTTIALGMLANLSFKTMLALSIGGRELARPVLSGMGAVAIGLGLGIAWTLL